MSDEEFQSAYGLTKAEFTEKLNALPDGAFWDGTIVKYLDKLIAYRKANQATKEQG